MSDTATLLRSFAGGEITPEMHGRLDLPKFQTALALCRNFEVLPYGPAQNRSGSALVNETKFSTRKSRLIPFAFNTQQTFAMEFGDRYIRFHTDGGTLLENAQGVTDVSGDSPVNLRVPSHGYVTGDWIFVSGFPDRPAINSRFVKAVVVDADTVALYALDGLPIAAPIVVPMGPSGPITVVRQLTLNGGALTLGGLPIGIDAFVVPLFVGVFGPLTFNSFALTLDLSELELLIPLPVITVTPRVARVYEITTSYLESELFDEHYVQSADVVTLASATHDPAELRRAAALNWTLTPISFVPNATAPVGVALSKLGIAVATTNYRYVVTSIGASGDESYASLPGVQAEAPRAVVGMTNANPGVFTTSAPHLFSPDDQVVFADDIVGPTSLNSTAWIVDTRPTDSTFTLRNGTTGALLDTSALSAFASGTIYVQEVKNDLTTIGASNNIAWQAVPGATRYRVYKLASGVYGFVGETPSLNFNDANITADTTRTPPQPVLSAPVGTGKQPRAVGYFEQRRAFGGSDNLPQTTLMSRPGTESNFSRSIPSQDDDSISFKFAARDVNVIRHIVPLQDLILLTSGGAWRLVSQNSDALTPTTISIRLQSTDGASMVQPVTTSRSILYAQARGGRIRELTYSLQAQGYESADASIFAPHLFDGFQITDMTYVRAPNQIAWMTRSDGVLLGLTYVPEQSILAWHQHATDGSYESVCAIGEGNEDALYTIVKRTVNGRTVRFVERKATRKFATPDDAFFVDCGLTYDGRNTGSTTLTVATLGDDYSTASVMEVTASAAVFSAQDYGRTIVVNALDATGALVDQVRILVLSVSSGATVEGYPDKTVPLALREAATTAWERAIRALSGFWHLDGKTLALLGDAAVLPPVTVVDGTITIDNPCSVLHGGLPYVSDLQTLPLVLEQAQTQGQGLRKNVGRVSMRVYASSGIFAGPSFDDLVEYQQRTTEVYGEAPQLITGTVDIDQLPAWTDDGSVCVRQSDPLPLTVSALSIELAVGG